MPMKLPDASREKKGEHFLRKWMDRAVSAFVFFHVLAIGSWCLPFNPAPVRACRSLAGPYLLWSGLFQSWDMFAPSPLRTNSYLEARLIYADGTTEYWAFPRMDRMSLTERYAKERYRKFKECLLMDRNSDLWPDAARHVARQARKRSKHPEIVALIVNWSELVENADGSFSDLPWRSRVFYRYRTEPDDFK